MKVQVIELIFVTATQLGAAELNIETGELLLGFHFGKITTIFPFVAIELVQAQLNFNVSVAPTVYVADVSVTARAPGVAATVNELSERSINVRVEVIDVIVNGDVVFE